MALDVATLQASAPHAGTGRIVQHDARQATCVEEGWADLVITSPPYPNNYDYADAARLEMTFLGDVASWGDLQQKVRKHLVRSCSQHMVGYDARSALSSTRLAPIHPELAPIFEQLEELRQTRAGRKAYGAMVIAYFDDLALVWQALRRSCAEGAKVCFVVGDSAPYGVHVPVERWLGELALAQGFKRWSFERLRARNVKWKNRKHRVPLQEGRLWVEG
jgi:hypothetical protein